MTDFSQDLLVSEDGFGLYLSRFDSNLKSMSDMVTFFKKLSKCEQTYAKELASIVDPKLWKKTGGELGTMQASWSSLNKELNKIATQHEEIANNINTQVVALEKFHKEKTTVKKTLMKDGSKLTKEMHDAMNNLKRSKENYYKEHKNADTQESNYNQKKSEGTKKPKELDKMSKNVADAKEKSVNADNQYNKMLETANSVQNKFYSVEMPSLLREFQRNEEERTLFFKSIMKSYMESLNHFPPLFSGVTDTLNKVVEEIDPKSDVATFISDHTSEGIIPPQPLEYEPYGTDGSAPPAGARSMTSAKKQAGGLAGNTTISGPAAGVSAAPKTFAGSATVGGAVGPKKTVGFAAFGLGPEDAHLSADEKKKKLEGQLTKVKEMIKTEIKSKKGLDKLTQFYANDPVAQQKAHSEAEEQQIKIDNLKGEKKKILNQLAEFGVTAGESDGDVPQNGAPAEADDYVEIKAKALFDYDAANDTELAFKAGDVLLVTEQDESGWWYAELNGKAGFIPNNYVEIIT